MLLSDRCELGGEGRLRGNGGVIEAHEDPLLRAHLLAKDRVAVGARGGISAVTRGGACGDSGPGDEGEDRTP